MVANDVGHDVAGVGITLWHGAHDGARDGGIFGGAGDAGIQKARRRRAGDYVTVNDDRSRAFTTATRTTSCGRAAPT